MDVLRLFLLGTVYALIWVAQASWLVATFIWRAFRWLVFRHCHGAVAWASQTMTLLLTVGLMAVAMA